MGTGLVDDPIFHCDGPVDLNRWVFHYTTLAKAMMIATSGTLWLNPLSTMNDPREYKMLKVPVVSYGTATKADIQAIDARINAWRLAVRAASFTRDQRVGDPDSMPRSDNRGFARPMMWTHYGDRHRGVCLVFDRDAIRSAVRRSYPKVTSGREVIYRMKHTPTNWTPTLELFDLKKRGREQLVDEFIDRHRVQLLFRKNC